MTLEEMGTTMLESLPDYRQSREQLSVQLAEHLRQRPNKEIRVMVEEMASRNNIVLSAAAEGRLEDWLRADFALRGAQYVYTHAVLDDDLECACCFALEGVENWGRIAVGCADGECGVKGAAEEPLLAELARAGMESMQALRRYATKGYHNNRMTAKAFTPYSDAVAATMLYNHAHDVLHHGGAASFMRSQMDNLGAQLRQEGVGPLEQRRVQQVFQRELQRAQAAHTDMDEGLSAFVDALIADGCWQYRAVRSMVAENPDEE